MMLEKEMEKKAEKKKEQKVVGIDSSVCSLFQFFACSAFLGINDNFLITSRSAQCEHDAHET